MAGCEFSPEAPRDAVNGDATEKTGRVASAIQGGTATTAYSFALGICQGEVAGRCNTICSGALIAPNLVLTSRHCVDVAPETTIDCAKDQFGPPRGTAKEFWVTTNASTNQTSTGWHSASRLFRTPGTILCGNDIALIQLADSIPATEAEIVTPILGEMPPDAFTFSAIGFGATTPRGPDLGARRVRRDVPIRCLLGIDTPLPCSPVEVGLGMRDGEFMSGDGICFGDSGSGAYIQGDLDHGRARTVGVLTRGIESGDRCQLGIYTSTAAWADLLAYATRAATPPGSEGPAWLASAPKPNRELGARCSESEACDSGTCASPGGATHFVCTHSCDPQMHDADCPAGFRCGAGVGVGGGFCFRQTSAPRPDTGWTCTMANDAEPRAAGAILIALLTCGALRRRHLARARCS